MKGFRRSGLADDDEIGARAVTLRFRASDDSSTFLDEQESAWEEESVVSAMTSKSDLESVYIETSSKNRRLEFCDRFLLYQCLPEPSRTNCTILSEQERRDRSSASAAIANEVEDDDDYSNVATWLEPRRQPWQTEYPGRTTEVRSAGNTLDPAPEYMEQVARIIGDIQQLIAQK